MALIVEDGAGLSTAESYISVADASTYHTARGNAAWAALATTALKEEALRRATDYMVANYSTLWVGCRVLETQALDWPRYDAVVHGFLLASTAVPEAVKRACAELALRAAAGDLQADVGAQVVSETVGPISVTYAQGTRQNNSFKAVDALLAAYFMGRGQIPMVRA